MQRVRLDRIDFALRPPVHDQLAGNAKNDTAGKRHRYRDNGIKPQQARQPLARTKMKEQPVQGIDAGAHGGHNEAGNRADQRRKHDQARFTRADDGPKAPGYFQSADYPIDHRITRPLSCAEP